MTSIKFNSIREFKYFLIFFLFVTFTFNSYCQVITPLLDTIYTGQIELDESVIYYNQNKAKIFHKQSFIIEDYHHITDHKIIVDSNGAIVKIEEEYFLLKRNGKINLDKPINLDFHQTKYSIIRNDILISSLNHGVEIIDITKPEIIYKSEELRVGNDVNSVYVKLIDHNEDVSIYNYEKKELTKIPFECHSLNMINSNFIVNTIFKVNSCEVELYDTEMNQIVSVEDGYKSSQVFQNMVILRKDAWDDNEFDEDFLVFKDGKEVIFDKGVQSYTILNSSISKARNQHGKYALMDRNQNLLTPYIFENIKYGMFYEGITGVMTDSIYLFNDSGELLLKGQYDKAKIIYNDRFEVSLNRQVEVIDQKGNSIISASENNIHYSSHNEFGKKLIKASNRLRESTLYSNDGRKIVRWNLKKGEVTIRSDKYIYGYYLSLLKSLTEEQISEINLPKYYVLSTLKNMSNIYRIIDINKNYLTPFLYSIRRLNDTDTFQIKTLKSKYGIVQVH